MNEIIPGKPCADGSLPVLTEKPDPNPEWEAKADAAHAAIVAEVGPGNPFDTLKMLETWKAHAEPADCDGKISFSRALLDSAQDALRAALEMARSEHVAGKFSFVRGAQEAREMLARFVEQGGDAVTANSLRHNWNPAWGTDPVRGLAETPPVAERGEWGVGDRARVIDDNEYGDGAADIGIEFIVEGLREGSRGRTVLVTSKATRGFDGFYAERCERPPPENSADDGALAPHTLGTGGPQ